MTPCEKCGRMELEEDKVLKTVDLVLSQLLIKDAPDNNGWTKARVISDRICASFSAPPENPKVTVESIIDAMHIPITRIRETTYYYMCKDDIAQAIIDKLNEVK